MQIHTLGRPLETITATRLPQHKGRSEERISELLTLVTSVPEFWQFVMYKGKLCTSQGKGHMQHFSLGKDGPCSPPMGDIPLLTSHIVALSFQVLAFPYYGGSLDISKSARRGIFFTYGKNHRTNVIFKTLFCYDWRVISYQVILCGYRDNNL